MAINHLDTGNFVNAQSNYYSAPQQVNGAGDIIGHTHFTVSNVGSFTSTQPEDPNTFAFFKGVNGAAVNGVVSENVSAGLPAGIYRVCSMNTDANHAPCLVAVAQHGTLDDCVYVSCVAPMHIVFGLIHVFSSPSVVLAKVEIRSAATTTVALAMLPQRPRAVTPLLSHRQLLLVTARHRHLLPPQPLLQLLARAKGSKVDRVEKPGSRVDKVDRTRRATTVASKVAQLAVNPALSVNTNLWDCCKFGRG
jgi:hypothetical protein